MLSLLRAQVGELRSCKSPGMAKKKKRKKILMSGPYSYLILI